MKACLSWSLRRSESTNGFDSGTVGVNMTCTGRCLSRWQFLRWCKVEKFPWFERFWARSNEYTHSRIEAAMEVRKESGILLAKSVRLKVRKLKFKSPSIISDLYYFYKESVKNNRKWLFSKKPALDFGLLTGLTKRNWAGNTRKKIRIKIATAGSVDDGKSTWSGACCTEYEIPLTTDKNWGIERSSRATWLRFLEFVSLATDGCFASGDKANQLIGCGAYLFQYTKNEFHCRRYSWDHVEYNHENMVTGLLLHRLPFLNWLARKGSNRADFIGHFFYCKILLRNLFNSSRRAINKNGFRWIMRTRIFKFKNQADFDVLVCQKSTSARIRFTFIRLRHWKVIKYYKTFLDECLGLQHWKYALDH